MAEVWVDPDWYATQESDDPCPSPGLPGRRRWREERARRAAVGEPQHHPQIDCGADSGVSRRQAQLTTDGQRWWVEDLQSSNGTYVGPAGAPLPTTRSRRPAARALRDDRVYLGAWTRIVVRRATPEEKGH